MSSTTSPSNKSGPPPVKVIIPDQLYSSASKQYKRKELEKIVTTCINDNLKDIYEKLKPRPGVIFTHAEVVVPDHSSESEPKHHTTVDIFTVTKVQTLGQQEIRQPVGCVHILRPDEKGHRVVQSFPPPPRGKAKLIYKQKRAELARNLVKWDTDHIAKLKGQKDSYLKQMEAQKSQAARTAGDILTQQRARSADQAELQRLSRLRGELRKTIDDTSEALKKINDDLRSAEAKLAEDKGKLRREMEEAAKEKAALDAR